MAETAGIAIALKAIGSQLFEDATARKRAERNLWVGCWWLRAKELLSAITVMLRRLVSAGFCRIVNGGC